MIISTSTSLPKCIRCKLQSSKSWCSPCIDILDIKSTSRLVCIAVDIFNEHGFSQEDLIEFDKSLCGRAVYPWSKGYEDARLNYNLIYTVFPLVIVRAKCVDDVQRTVKWSRKHKLPIAVCSGGHCFKPFSLITNGVIIDQEDRVGVKVLSNSVVNVQPGIRLGPLIKVLAKHNLTLPVGTCSNNGVAGFTLGGGFGFASRMYGILSDRLESVKIVLADGSVVDANKRCNKDLFFACQGGRGGNFGIVVEFVYKAVPLPRRTVYFQIIYPLGSRLWPLINRWQRWSDESINANSSISRVL